jgi:hypothetical protein
MTMHPVLLPPALEHTLIQHMPMLLHTATKHLSIKLQPYN